VAAGWFEVVAAGSETGRLAASLDWSATPLGPTDGWPLALRLAVETCFSTRFPMLVVWGPDLTKIYNDGYRLMLGSEKHPAAMGAPAREVWAEIWDVIEPQFRQVLDTGVPTFVEDQLLLMHRNGFLEETYFTYSYSPIRNEDGSIGGVLDTCTETTEQVVTARRLATLNELRGRLVLATTVWEVCHIALEVLRADEPDVCAAEVHVVHDDRIVSSADAEASEDDVRRALAGDGPVVVGEQVRAPMGEVGVLGVRPNPHRPFDDGYRSFLALASSTMHMAILEVRRRSAELDELRRTSSALQLAMLPVLPPRPDLATRYLPASQALSVGGDWYEAVELGGGRLALVVGDTVGHGLAAATTMGQLRSACRALLLEGLSPSAALDGLDRFAQRLDGAESTTAFCAVLDPATGDVTYSSAGHPAPLVEADGTTAWLDQAGGLPLAVQVDEPRPEARHHLDPGDVLVLYTDGLVERRGESLETGFARLADLARGQGGLDPEDLADHLIGALVAGDHDDDVAVAVYRRPQA
jgi:hypothetical protein